LGGKLVSHEAILPALLQGTSMMKMMTPFNFPNVPREKIRVRSMETFCRKNKKTENRAVFAVQKQKSIQEKDKKSLISDRLVKDNALAMSDPNQKK